MSKHKKYYNNGSKPTRYTPQNATPKKKQDKKDWTYWLVVIALAFTFIGSILGTVSFAKGCIEDYQQKNALSSIHSVEDIAKYRTEKPFINSAFDTVTEDYTYDGNNLFIPTCETFVNGSPSTLTASRFLSVDVILTKVNNQLYFYIKPILNIRDNVLRCIYNTSSYPFETLADHFFPIDANGYSYGLASNFYGVCFYYDDYLTSGFSSSYGYMYLLNDTDFNCNVVSISFSSYKELYWFSNPNDSYLIQNSIIYTDSNGKKCELIFNCYARNNSAYTGYLEFEPRTYYLSTEFNDNQYYQNGLQQGYENGKVDGEKIGYENGYQNGRLDGYNNGYNAGAESASEFTFLGLFGALFDAPITALQGLLNFNLLGFNMFNFFTALLTIGLIIFIVRLFV